MKSEGVLDLGGIVWSLPSTGENKSLDEQKIINVEGTYWTKNKSDFSGDTEETLRAKTVYFGEIFLVDGGGDFLNYFHQTKCVSYGLSKVEKKKEKIGCHKQSGIGYGSFDGQLSSNGSRFPFETYDEIVKKFEERFDCKLTKSNFYEVTSDTD